jgi:hypothetical protein
LQEQDKRILQDRRKIHTPILSRYTFWGRRKVLRRKADQERGGYVDRYSASLLFFLLLIVGLNVLDALFTMVILDRGGWEVNPLVRSAMAVYGDRFWVWKFALVSANVFLLCLHSRFQYVQKIIWGITFLFLAIILYQTIFLNFH